MTIRLMQTAKTHEWYLTAVSHSTGKTVYWDGAGWSLLRSSAKVFDDNATAVKLWKALAQPQAVLHRQTTVIH